MFKDFNAKLEMVDSYGGRPKKVRQSFLSNPAAVVKEILANSKVVHQKYHFYDMLPLLEGHLKKDESIDDKMGSIEQLIEMLILLPAGPPSRSCTLTSQTPSLIPNFQHPPWSYLGGNVRCRAVEGIKKANGQGVGKAKSQPP